MEMKIEKMNYKVLFSGQHKDLITDFKHLVNTDIILDDIMIPGQTLNK